MKKVYIKRSLALLLTFVTLSLISIFFVNATDIYSPTQWIMDENLQYIYGGQKRYDRYYVNGVFYSDSETCFYFSDNVEFNKKSCEIYGESAYPHIVSVEKDDGYNFVFVDEDGKKALDSLKYHTNCIYYLEDYQGEYVQFDEKFISYLDICFSSGYPYMTVERIEDLYNGDVYEITGHDSYKTHAYLHGILFFTNNGNCYYLPCEQLSDRYFDQYGCFSYTYGDVVVLKVDNEISSQIKENIGNMDYRPMNYIYEEDVISGYCDINGEIIYDNEILLFWIFFIPLAIILPLVFCAGGTVLANIKMPSKNKSWYWLTVLGGIWLLSSIIIIIVALN